MSAQLEPTWDSFTADGAPEREDKMAKMLSQCDSPNAMGNLSVGAGLEILNEYIRDIDEVSGMWLRRQTERGIGKDAFCACVCAWRWGRTDRRTRSVLVFVLGGWGRTHRRTG